MRPLTLLLVLILSASLCVFAQTAPPAGPVVVGGYATSAPMSPPLINTPKVDLNVTSADPIGASAATGMNQVGASSSTLNPNASATLIEEEVPTSNVPTTGVSNGNTLIVVSPITNYRATGMAPARSLGEVAAWYRQHAQHATRVYTNDDIARLNQQNSNLPSSDQGMVAAPANGVLSNGAKSDNANTVPAFSKPLPATDNTGGVLPSTVVPPVSAPESKPATKPSAVPPDSKRSPFIPPAAPPTDDKLPPARPPQ